MNIVVNKFLSTFLFFSKHSELGFFFRGVGRWFLVFLVASGDLLVVECRIFVTSRGDLLLWYEDSLVMARGLRSCGMQV